MRDTQDLRYVDFASKALLGFRNYITQVKDLPVLTKKWGHTDCFCTYFLFDRGLPDYAKQNHGSVSGYQGPCYANFLPLDIDSPDINQALHTAKKVTGHLLDGWGMPEDALGVYYSGMKGFHVMLPVTAFGEVKPSTDLPKVFREVRRSVVAQAKVKYPHTIDFSISDRLRLLRLPNTRHSKSGLYKVPLQIEELLSYESQEIAKMAGKPRPLWLTDESGLVPKSQVKPVPDAVELYQRCTEQAEKNCHSDLPDPGSFLNNATLNETLCQAELELYREGVPDGSRSAMCLRFASRLRSAGYSQQLASDMVESFAGRCRPPLERYAARQIVTSAYKAGGKGYQFGCGTGNSDPAHTRVVFDRCRYKTDRLKCDTFGRFYSQLDGNNGQGGGLD